MSGPNDTTPEQAVQREPPKHAAPSVAQAQPSGRRQAFQDLKRGLTEKELSSPAAQKLLLDMLECAEAERDEFKEYVRLYHDADKKAAVLNEKLTSNRVNEVLSGVGIGLGGTILGLAPTFWGTDSKGPICAAIGAALIAGSALGRILFK